MLLIRKTYVLWMSEEESDALDELGKRSDLLKSRYTPKTHF